MKNENRKHGPWSLPSMTMTRRHGLVRKVAAGAVVAGLALGVATPADAAPVEGLVSAASIVGLTIGSSGTEVAAVQQALMAAGVSVRGGADGRFGPATASAVSAFQARKNLPTTGQIDAATAAALGVGQGASPGPRPAIGQLQVGARGAAVKTLQQDLQAVGVPVFGGADGVFGQGTKTAVSRFQRWNGLAVTGVADSATLSLLQRLVGRQSSVPAVTTGASASATASKASAPSTAGSSLVGLKVGSTGSAVKDLQRRLQATGLVIRGGADGIFGNVTKSAVQAFQKVNGLEQTGVVTAEVAALLGGGAAPAAPAPTAARTPVSSFAGLKIGNSGDKVARLQRALQNAGVTVFGGADGSFGNATKRALVAFQRVNGLPQTGVLSADGARILGLESTASAPPPSAASGSTASGYPTPGENSARTRALQEQLIAWNIQVVGGADAAFGANTVAAIKRFQQAHGLSVTGTVTAETAKKLQLPPMDKIPPVDVASIKLDRFPVQGRCYFGDTYGAARGGGRAHVGVDIIAEEGQYLYAVVDGKIAKRFHDVPGALSGNGVRLTMPNGTYFTYLHMLDVAPGIEVGTEVKAGDIIGFVGNTGSSATAHLHFEIHPGGGAAINPYPYVRAIDACKDTSDRFQTSYLPAG